MFSEGDVLISVVHPEDMSSIPDVRWMELPTNQDERGILTSVEEIKDIPIEIKRVFFMHQVVAERGGHAHIDTDQVLFVVHGSLMIELSDGNIKMIEKIEDPSRGIYIPRMIFTKMYDFSPDAVCVVLANTNYDKSRSIRTYQDFLHFLEK